MTSRLLCTLALALAATAAQAAPEVEIRAGTLNFGPSGSQTYTGIGLRHRFDDTWAISGDYTTTLSDGSANVSSSLTQFGGYAELGRRGDDWRASIKVGAVYNEFKLGNQSASETAPAFGVEFIWRSVGIAWTHSALNGQTIDATSLILRF